MSENKISFVLPIALSDTGRDEKDHQRMMLLLESFEAFFNLEHLEQFFIVCPPANKELLQGLLGKHLQRLKIVIIDENILCPEFINDPDTSTAWPKVNKGWYRQQLIKLAIHERMQTAFYMTLDADVIFCRAFDIKDIISDGKANLNVQSEQDYQRLYKRKWAEKEIRIRVNRYQDAERVLQCVRDEHYASLWYGETPVIMNTGVVSELAAHLEKQWQKPWREVLLENLPWNEYPLYFLFLENTQKLDVFYRLGNCNSILRLESCLWLPEQNYREKRNIDSWQKICQKNKNRDGIAVVVQSYLDYPLEQVADIARTTFGFNSSVAKMRMAFHKIKKKFITMGFQPIFRKS